MQSFRVSRARVAGGFRIAAASRHTRVGPRARVAFALERGADGRRAVARGPFGKHEGTAGPFGPFEGLRRDGSKLKRGSLRFWDGRGWQRSLVRVSDGKQVSMGAWRPSRLRDARLPHRRQYYYVVLYRR